jgi:tRNA(Arg) A34 adenosine deaminase TadA
LFYQPSKIGFSLPEWIADFSQHYVTTTDAGVRMQFVIAASQKNIEEASGGPFAAAVFEAKTGQLVSLGVNLVMTEGLSMLHAEIVAIAIAQRKLNTYDLGGISMPDYELAISTEPCAMCLGAIPWSGIRHVMTGATDEDARAIGFDEGTKPENWVHILNERGIQVKTHIEQEAARAVLEFYKSHDGHIYNSRERGLIRNTCPGNRER